VENVNEVTQTAASAAEEMSASTEQLSGLAQELQQMTAQFKIGEEDTAARSARKAAAGGNSHNANGEGHGGKGAGEGEAARLQLIGAAAEEGHEGAGSS